MDNKKKLVQISALALAIMGLLAAAWPVYAADVDDALYMADIAATNTGTATTEVSAVCDINTDALIDGKFVTSDLLNTAIQTSDGTDIAYMPGVDDNPWALFIPSIGGTETRSYVLYAGGPAMQTGLDYFPDDGGMTTADADSLEPGDTFQIEQKGYIDTDAGSDKYLANKEDALGIYDSDDEEITAAIASSLPSFSSTSDGGIYATGVYATAQAAASGTVSDGATTFTVGQRLASPTILGTNSGTNSNTTNHTINLPSSVAAGDLLLIFIDFVKTAAGSFTLTDPAGFAPVFVSVYNTGTYYSYHICWYKVATGGKAQSPVPPARMFIQLTLHTG